MPVRRRLFALVAAVAVVASGLVTGGAASAATATIDPAPNGYVPPAVVWDECARADDFPANFQCGTVSVPLDWSDVGGAKITLALTRVVHTAEPYQGVMLVNPGGPGGSGTIYAFLKDAVPNGGGDSYDWVGFDPRGVGASKPSLSCDPDYFSGVRPAYEPSTKKLERAWRLKAKAYSAACAAKNGPLLAHMTTEDSVKDMDAIRVALGQEQINYLGYSYGTYLGQVYGTLFPSHLRRAVFDSSVDPRKSSYQSGDDQNVAFEKVIRAFFSWTAEYDRVYHLGKTQSAVSKRYYAVQAGLDTHPVSGIEGDDWNDIVLTAGYSQATWPAIASVFSDWAVKHSRSALKGAYANFAAVDSDNDYAAFLATTCGESPWPSSWSVFAADARRLDRVAPFITWGSDLYTAPCLTWPGDPATPVVVDGSKVTGVLLIDETLDAATPYAGSLEVRRRFPKAVLLAEPGGTSHANSLSGNACVDNTIARYFKNGTLPTRKAGGGADKTCKPLPLPKPTKSSVSGSGSGSSRVAGALISAGLFR